MKNPPNFIERHLIGAVEAHGRKSKIFEELRTLPFNGGEQFIRQIAPDF